MSKSGWDIGAVKKDKTEEKEVEWEDKEAVRMKERVEGDVWWREQVSCAVCQYLHLITINLIIAFVIHIVTYTYPHVHVHVHKVALNHPHIDNPNNFQLTTIDVSSSQTTLSQSVSNSLWAAVRLCRIIFDALIPADAIAVSDVSLGATLAVLYTSISMRFFNSFMYNAVITLMQCSENFSMSSYTWNDVLSIRNLHENINENKYYNRNWWGGRKYSNISFFNLFALPQIEKSFFVI